MRVATFNVNSIRSRLDLVVDWLQNHQPDILASPPLAQQCSNSYIDLEPRRTDRPSDHTVLVAEFELFLSSTLAKKTALGNPCKH